MAENNEPKKRDFAMHVNEIMLLGRAYQDPVTSNNGKVVRVPMVLPTFKSGGGRQWTPFPIDFIDDLRESAKKVTVGDFVRCSARLADRRVVSDEGDKKTFKILQVDPYRPMGVLKADAPEDPTNPPMDDLCFSRVILAGRSFIRKKQMEEGKGDTPILREGKNGDYCWVTMRYEDPFQDPPPDGEYWKSIFIDFALNGEAAKFANEYMKNRSQVLFRGELNKKELDFTIKGNTVKEPTIHPLPYGVNFVNLSGGGGAGKKPKGAEEVSQEGNENLDSMPF